MYADQTDGMCDVGCTDSWDDAHGADPVDGTIGIVTI